MSLRPHTHDMCSTQTWLRNGGRCSRTASASTSSRMRPATPSATAPALAPPGSALPRGTPHEERPVTWPSQAMGSALSWMEVPLPMGMGQSFRSGAAYGTLRRLLPQTHYGLAGSARVGSNPNQQPVLRRAIRALSGAPMTGVIAS